MNRPRRVAVTGIGAITPIGNGARDLWKGVRAGRSAVRRVTRFDPSEYRSQNAAEIQDFDAAAYMEQRAVRKLDRFAQLGIAASRQAVTDAGLCLDACDRSRVGVSIGSALGGLAYAEDQHVRFLAGGIRTVDAMLAVAVYGGASGANVGIDLGLRGPNLANANSCASGAMAIGEAFRVIRRGEADVMLAGGVEAPLAPLIFGSFSLIKAMSARNHEPSAASRPFDSQRDGFVMGEGAAVLTLEEYGSAHSRGATVYAELVGYGQTNDAFHMTAPRPDGSEAARAMSQALGEAKVSPGRLNYVNAHATGTRLGDAAEARALRSVLGESAASVPISGTKGLYGHALGASGAIEAAITAIAMRCTYLPGTANFAGADDGCGLNILPPEGRPGEIEVALSTSFGFGGANAALVFARDSSSA